MMTGRRIDVARIISNDMRNVAESGKEFGYGIKSSCPLVFPGLIMALLIASRVRLLNLTIFKIKTKVDDKPFYQEEGVGPEEEAEAGTSGGSKTASEAGDGMESEFMGREE
ncbi:hypothetical protein RYX36_008792 [Vicia faba]